MPAFIVPGGAQVRLRWSYQGRSAMNVFGAVGATSANINQSLADTLGTTIKAAVASSGLQEILATSVQLNKVSAKFVGEAGWPDIEDAGAAVVGTGTGDPLGRGMAAVVTLRTARAGLSYRGRVFIGGFVEAVNESDVSITTSAAAAIEGFVQDVIDAINSTVLDAAVLSPALPERTNASGETLPAKAAFGTAITGVTLRNDLWGSQRGRNKRP